jgi:hypothetical protein
LMKQSSNLCAVLWSTHTEGRLPEEQTHTLPYRGNVASATTAVARALWLLA